MQYFYILRGENKRLKKFITDEQKLLTTKADLLQQVQAGLITTQRAQELYSNQVRLIKSARKNRQAKNIMVLIGSILIGLGIILLGFYNWGNLSQIVKLFVATSWLVLAQIVFYFTIIKKIFFKNHPEAVSALYALTVGGSIILTSNTYPLTYDVTNGLLTWMLLILPAIYIAQSVTIATVYSLVMMYWAICEWNQSFVLIIWLLIAMILPFTYKVLEEKKTSVQIFFTMLAMSTVVAFVVSMLDYWQGFSLQITMIFVAMILLCANRLKVKNYLLERISFGGILAINLFLTFSASWNGFLGINVAKAMPSDTLLVVYLAITAVMMMLVNKIHLLGRLNLELTVIALTPFFVGAATVAVFYKLDALYSMGIISVYLICLALAIAYDGLKINSSATLNKGLSVLTLLIVVRFFDSQMSFQSRAIAFIAVGILFLASNWFLRHRTNRQDRYNEEISENIFASDSLEISPETSSNNLVINLNDALQQVKLLQQEESTSHNPVLEKETMPTPESTATVTDSNIINTTKESLGWSPPNTYKDGTEEFFAPKTLTPSSNPTTNNLGIAFNDVLPQEKPKPPLPASKSKPSNDSLSPKETTITIKDFDSINLSKNPSGNVKIISDNTSKITMTDTQRFKNINEIKKL